MRSKTSKRTAKKSKPPKPHAKAPADQAHVAQVFLWLVQGQTQYHIAAAIAQEWPGQQAQPLIDAALEQLARATEFNPKIARGWCLEAYRELHRRMMELGDFAAAIRAVARVEAIIDEAGQRDDQPAPSPQHAHELDEARAHLAPLFEEGETMALPELARLAAARILISP